jgi:hypothetical protein
LVTVENVAMTDSYEWLDEDRRGTEVYADEVHQMCACHWDLHHVIGQGEMSLPAMRLIARLKRCPIHGAKGSI